SRCAAPTTTEWNAPRGAASSSPQRHPATVARRLALAHRIAEEIDAGRYADQTDVVRHHGLTRAPLTQLMNLLLLAPDMQEEVLALEYPAGRAPITERTLRGSAGAVGGAAGGGGVGASTRHRRIDPGSRPTAPGGNGTCPERTRPNPTDPR